MRKIKSLLQTHGPIPGYRKELGLLFVEVPEEEVDEYEFDEDVYVIEAIPTLRKSYAVWYTPCPVSDSLN